MLIETHSLSKFYGEVAALDDCSLGVARGEVFGLLGPNGAGKTTLLRLLLGLLRPSAGHALIDGLDTHLDSVRVRRLVSYLPGDVRLFRQMRGRELLRFFAEIRPDGDFQRSLELAQRMELDVSRRVAFLSTGMRQKLALAATFAPPTPLLVLDEPTSNLDPNMRALLSAMVVQAKQEGRTVIFSSHVLPEVEEVCDRVAILRAGRLVHTQVVSQLRKQHRIHALLNGPLPPLPESLRAGCSVAMPAVDRVTIDAFEQLASLLGWLATLPVREIRIEPIGLRAIYDRYHAQEPRGATQRNPSP